MAEYTPTTKEDAERIAELRAEAEALVASIEAQRDARQEPVVEPYGRWQTDILATLAGFLGGAVLGALTTWVPDMLFGGGK